MRGIDIGTCFLVTAARDDNQEIQVKSIRDAFLDLDNEPEVKNLLKMSDVNFIESDDKLYIIGDKALVMANIFKRDARRPLSQGVISPGELEAERILLVLLENLMGKAKTAGETCFYSVPGAPIDRDMDIIYHQAMFSKLIGSMGYTPRALNEAAAISYSNAAKEQFSSLSISCLPPGQKVITNRGFVNIENVKEGDQVLTKDGTWNTCSPTSRTYQGKVISIDAYGNGTVDVTADHQVWACRDKKWSFIPAKDLVLGDLVMQPWPDYSFDEERYICVDHRITCSKPKQINLNLTCQMSELIGYFLGDGCIEYAGKEASLAGIGFTFDKKEQDNIDRVKQLVEDLFDKEVAIYPHGDNAVRLKMYSKSFAEWAKNNCYDGEKQKIVPWNISDLTDNQIRFILAGLIKSDGTVTEQGISFYNTSGSLAQFVYLAMLKLGMGPSCHVRPPREGKVVLADGHSINGKKEEFNIRSSGVEARGFAQWMLNPSRGSKKSSNFGSTVAPITGLGSRDYDGMVYDLVVTDGGDHSFCVPGIALHNCGAGMVNVCLMYQTVIGMAFSLSRGGDWIDIQAAKVTGSTAGRIQSIKERGIDLMNPEKGDKKTLREREAISIYYKSLAMYALDMIKEEFMKRQSSIELPHSIPIILSGGTAKAANFKEFFETAFNSVKEKFPIPISEVRMASDPLNAVAQGLLVAAMNFDEGEKK